MQFIRPDINLNIIDKRYIAIACSLLLIGLGVASLVFHGGPHYGIDFAGGTEVRVKFSEPVNTDALRKALIPLGLGKSTVQQYGATGDNEYRISADVNQLATLTGKKPGDAEQAPKSGAASEQLTQSIESKVQGALTNALKKKVEIRGVEMVGPQVGKDLRQKALYAIFYSLLFMAVYIAYRFEAKLVPGLAMIGILAGTLLFVHLFTNNLVVLIIIALVESLALFWLLRLPYALGAVVSLVHDVAITVGIFSLMSKEFTLPFVAAILTVIGYSINDTIIVYDRIRENTKKLHRQPLDFIINRSINETLSRTILTSGTVMFVLIALFFFGGEVIHDFSLALIIGVITGTYSSIYIASPIVIVFQQFSKAPRIAAKKSP